MPAASQRSSGVRRRGSSAKPDFFIVGAPKCGTSSLHHYLRQHPDVFLPDQKDVPFFGSDLEHTYPNAPSDLDEYLSSFSAAPRNCKVGDSCTQYMQSRQAAQEIAEFNPDASIIVMLRDPVDLIFSLHSHNIWMTEEDILDFETAVEAESDRRRGDRIPQSCNYPAGLWYRDVAALGDQLDRWLGAFPSEKVHVILFDDLRSDLRRVVDAALRFLGVDPDVELDLSRVVNSRRTPRSVRIQSFVQQPPAGLERIFRAVMPDSFHGRVLPFLGSFNESKQSRQVLSPELRRRLGDELRPQVQKLEALTGRGLGGWCRPDLGPTPPTAVVDR